MRRLSPSRLALFAAVLALAATTAATASAHGRDDGKHSGDRGGKQVFDTSYGYGDGGGNSGPGSYGGNQGDDHGRGHHRRDPGYTVTPLIADQAGAAPTVDPNLVNGWGITEGPTTPWWVANQGTNTSSLYSDPGVVSPLVVKVDG